MIRNLLALACCSAFACAPFACAANDQEIQRALIQRDQQSAEFAAGVRGADRSALEALHARQQREIVTQPLHPDPGVAQALQPYQRQKMADERALALPPPAAPAARPPERPLPLPGGPGRGVEPVAPHDTPK